jgi:hypothetical protein
MKLTIDEVNKLLESSDPLRFTDAQIDSHTHGARISAGKRGIPINVGRPVSELARQRASEVHSGRVVNALTKAKIAAARTAQLVERYSKPKATCQHCGVVTWPAQIKRFHADAKCLQDAALKAAIKSEVTAARAAGKSWPSIARSLNERNMKTVTGKDWTAATVALMASGKEVNRSV